MTDQPSILVLNGSHAEIPLIMAAQRLGFRVITTGAAPDGLGHVHADLYAPADFSDPIAITSLARGHNVVGVVSACNDFAAMTAARVAADLALPGHDSPETTQTIHHKDRLRDLMSTLGLPSIRSTRVSQDTHIPSILGHLNLPVIVKPVDLTGGKGMTVCDSPESVIDAVARALALSRESYVVVEEFVSGSHHGFTSFVTSGRVAWWFADDEQYFMNPFLVAGTCTPSSLKDDDIEEIICSVERIASELDLVDGLVHVQCVVSSDGPRILEICRRCPGDLYPEFVQLSTGHDYAAEIVRAELGLPLDLPEVNCQPTPMVRHCAMSQEDGVFRDVHVSPHLRNRVVSELELLSPGTRITHHLTQKQRIVFLQFADRQEIDEHLRVRDSDIRVIVEGA